MIVARLKAKVGAVLDRRYVRRDQHDRELADLRRRCEQLERLAQDPFSSTRGRQRSELIDDCADAIESLLQAELRIWQRLDALQPRRDAHLQNDRTQLE